MVQHGMVVTSQPLAAQAVCRFFCGRNATMPRCDGRGAECGGAHDVGVAATVLPSSRVREGTKNLCAELERDGAFRGDRSRTQFAGLSLESEKLGPTFGMPLAGILPVTVPGAVWGWQAGAQRFGQLTSRRSSSRRLGIGERLPVSERIAHDLATAQRTALKNCCTEPTLSRSDMVRQRAAAAGRADFQRMPILRERCAAAGQGGDGFYKVTSPRPSWPSRGSGGTMTLKDLANYKGKWVEPARVQYHGFDVLELPRPRRRGRDEYLNICRRACLSGRRRDAGVARTCESQVTGP